MKYLIFISLLCSNIFSFAQQKKTAAVAVYIKGYIINAKNEKIVGEIKEFKNDMEAYSKISFRESETKPTKQFLPVKIHGYGIEELHYASIRWLDMWVFMHVIQKGIINLYEYKPPVAMGNEKMQTQFYVIKGANTELIQVFPETKLKKQIKELIHDDKELFKEMDDMKTFEYGDYVMMIQRYNERHVN